MHTCGHAHICMNTCTDRHKHMHTCIDTPTMNTDMHVCTHGACTQMQCTRTDTPAHAHCSQACMCVQAHTDTCASECVYTHPNTAVQYEHACTHTGAHTHGFMHTHRCMHTMHRTPTNTCRDMHVLAHAVHTCQCVHDRHTRTHAYTCAHTAPALKAACEPRHAKAPL